MPRTSRRSLLAATAVSIGSGCLDHPLPPLRGVVTGKRIVGRTGVLLSVSDSGVAIENEALAGVASRENDDGNTTITATQARSLSDATYQVTIRHRNKGHLDGVEPGEEKTYRATRKVFNQSMVDDRIEFQVSVVNRPSLLTETKTVRTGRVERKWVVGTKDGDDSGTLATEKRLLNVSADGVEANGSVIDASRTVRKDAGAKLTNRFDSVQYSVVVNHEKRRRIYTTKRPQFNQARIGNRVNFEVNGDFNQKLVRYVE